MSELTVTTIVRNLRERFKTPFPDERDRWNAGWNRCQTVLMQVLDELEQQADAGEATTSVPPEFALSFNDKIRLFEKRYRQQMNEWYDSKDHSSPAPDAVELLKEIAEQQVAAGDSTGEMPVRKFVRAVEEELRSEGWAWRDQCAASDIMRRIAGMKGTEIETQT